MFTNFEYYRIFYFVAKHGSITAAANVLTSAQPNVTRSIRNLERDLGCALFTRSNHGVKLTPEGEKLYEHVAIAYAQIAEGEAEYMRILSETYSDESKQDFYSFVRSLDALKASMTGDNKTVILSPDSPIAQIFYGR